jgi:preprotein translocase subunit SecD
MFGSIRGRLAIIAASIILSAGALINNRLQEGRAMKLGLDLQGGMQLTLMVDDPQGTLTPEARQEAIDQNLEVLRNRIDQFGVAEPLIQKVGDDRIIVELPGISDEERAKNIIRQSAFLEWKLVRPTTEFRPVLTRLDRAIAEALKADSLAGLRPETAAADTTGGLARQDSTRQGLQEALFGRSDTTAADTTQRDSAAAPATPSQTPLGSLLLDSGRDGEFLIAEQEVERVKRYLALPGVMDQLPRGTELRWGKVEGVNTQLYRPLYFLESRPFITGERLREATAGRDPQFNKTVVTFELDRRGGRVFDQITSQHIDDRIAIVLDTVVHSAPVVISRIGANGQIDMAQAPMEEASDLALVLRAGALSKPLSIAEQRTVGPSLGRDSVTQGAVAGIVGLVFVIAWMIWIYRFSGFLAIVALCIYGLIVLGGMAMMDATLTAPGIAGFILSVGMAVDANVLIFERTREELTAGRSNRVAVDEGFKNAMSAIIDSHVTTIITGLILYQVGTGPVRGFAVTLTIGIIASLYTAVFVTRTFMLIYLDRKRPMEPISI